MADENYSGPRDDEGQQTSQVQQNKEEAQNKASVQERKPAFKLTKEQKQLVPQIEKEARNLLETKLGADFGRHKVNMNGNFNNVESQDNQQVNENGNRKRPINYMVNIQQKHPFVYGKNKDTNQVVKQSLDNIDMKLTAGQVHAAKTARGEKDDKYQKPSQKFRKDNPKFDKPAFKFNEDQKENFYQARAEVKKMLETKLGADFGDKGQPIADKQYHNVPSKKGGQVGYVMHADQEYPHVTANRKEGKEIVDKISETLRNHPMHLTSEQVAQRKAQETNRSKAQDKFVKNEQKQAQAQGQKLTPEQHLEASKAATLMTEASRKQEGLVGALRATDETVKVAQGYLGKNQKAIRSGDTIVPLSNKEGKITSVERLRSFKTKEGKVGYAKPYVLKGGQLGGSFNAIGSHKQGEPIWMAQDQQAAVKLHKATGQMAVNAQSYKNLAKTTKAVKEMHPDAQMVVTNRNMQSYKNAEGVLQNPAKHFAETVAKSVGGVAVMPQGQGQNPDFGKMKLEDVQKQAKEGFEQAMKGEVQDQSQSVSDKKDLSIDTDRANKLAEAVNEKQQQVEKKQQTQQQSRGGRS